MPTDRGIVQEFDEAYDQAYYVWNEFYSEADIDLRFFLGDQWDEREKRQLFQEGRNAYVFNKARRAIQLVSGYQRKHRQSSVVVPIEDSDQETADQFSQLLLYIMGYGDGYQRISECFSGALKTGWNLLSIWKDYRDDLVNGDIRFSRVPYNGFILDPYFTRLDFSDCNYILMRKYLSKEMTASLLPDHKKDIMQLHDLGWDRDDKFTWLPYQRQPNGEDLMAYNEMWVQKWRQVPMLIDMETGESTDWEGERERLSLYRDMYPQLEVVDRPRRYIERHVIVNDTYMVTEENPYDIDEYPFVPFVGIFEPESDEWSLKIQSLMRCMRDPQREANRRRSQMTDILDSQINSGWVAKENSVVNPHSLFQSSQGKVIWRRQHTEPSDIERIQPSQVPPSMFQMQEMFDNDLIDIVGVNDAAFGQTDTAGDSGVMMLLRQGAAIVNLQDLFDNLRYSQKMASQKVLKMVQSWTPQKIQRIINKEPTQQFFDREFTKYDVAVQEGILTDTQRQMYFRQLVDIKQIAPEVVTGDMLAKAAPIQGKTEFNEQIEQNQQAAQQAQQQQQQIEQQRLTAESQQSQAKAISDIALGKERFTRAVANLGLEDERASKAVEDRSDAALNRVKAVKEIEQMDDERFLKYLQIIRLMEQMNEYEEEEIKNEDVGLAQQPTSQRIPDVQRLLQEATPQQEEAANGQEIQGI